MFRFRLMIFYKNSGKRWTRYFSEKGSDEAKGEAVNHYPPHLSREKWKRITPTLWRKESGFCAVELQEL